VIERLTGAPSGGASPAAEQSTAPEAQKPE
jgi:hypothetical protein